MTFLLIFRNKTSYTLALFLRLLHNWSTTFLYHWNLFFGKNVVSALLLVKYNRYHYDRPCLISLECIKKTYVYGLLCLGNCPLILLNRLVPDLFVKRLDVWLLTIFFEAFDMFFITCLDILVSHILDRPFQGRRRHLCFLSRVFEL